MSIAAGAGRAPARLVAQWRQRAFRAAPADQDPVVLRHSRIYILPTPRGAAVIATLALMVLASLNYALSLGLAVAFLLIGLVSAALLHAFRNLAGIEVTPLSAGDTFAGGEVPFTLALHGGAAARTGVTLAAQGVRVTGDVPAGSAHAVTLAVPAPVRGRVALGRVTLSSDHPFGLWRAWAYVHFPLAGIVFPLAEVSAPPLPTGRDGADASGQGPRDDADLAGLRTYQRGDAPQRVAWKAVARGAGWYTKEFDGGGGGGAVALSFAALPALGTEERLSRLAAWVLAAERAARPFSLSMPQAQIAASQGRDHRRAALTALALHPQDG